MLADLPAGLEVPSDLGVAVPMWMLATVFPGSIAVVVEPAKAAEIAEELFLSTHTVRDHVKAIFHKVGVSSRGELVAKLVAEHYEPVHFEHAVHADLA